MGLGDATLKAQFYANSTTKGSISLKLLKIQNPRNFKEPRIF